jgi:hypothetical protein
VLVVERRVDGDLLLDDRVDAVAGADGLALEQLLGGELAAGADLLGPDRPPLVGEGDQVAGGEDGPAKALVEMRWTLTRPPVWGRLATQTPLEDWDSRKVELPSSAAASTRPRRGLWARVQVPPLPWK